MDYMERALSLAKRALGSVSPNPAVGAVVVKDGEIVGEGWTQPPGQAHAEIEALRRAGDSASGATLYVTLEPCNHFGRTPPCTQAIVDAGIAVVHVATTDPNPHVTGGGIARLNDEGIETHIGESEAKARQVIEAFTKYVTTGIPFVTSKFAMSLDGKIATRTGDSKWITGEESRWYVHQLRAESDAIMVGINTVLADNPQLTARDTNGNPLERQPLRVIVDSGGRLPDDAILLKQPGETLVATARPINSSIEKLARVEQFPDKDGRVDLNALLRTLGKREITSVFVEGGGTLLGSLFDLQLIDKVVAFTAPVIIGGSEAPSPVAGVGAERMVEAHRLRSVEIKQFGDDVAVIGYCEAKSDVHRNS